MKYLQRLGKALMQAIAVLPIAALMLGFGYLLDPSGWGINNLFAGIMVRAGQTVVDNLGLIFAAAIAYGMTREQHGAAALSGIIGFTTVTMLLSSFSAPAFGTEAPTTALESLSKIDGSNVFVGIVIGILAAWVYERFHAIVLPDAFAFFSGRRIVPIITGVLSLLVAGVLYVLWPILYTGLAQFGHFIIDLGAVGAGIYGFLNRLLIPTGLHHALNSVFWFNIANINDIPNFLGGAQSIAEGVAVVGKTGMYQAGFYPILMFGLPGAALAMYRTSRIERKRYTASLMIAGSVAAFITGVTEPLEFAFMFVAPLLYVVHALLTGVSLFLAASLQWMAGFGFSAGAIDLLLSAGNPLAVNWYMLIPLGLVFFVVYYVVFRTLILRFQFKTPGREDEYDEVESVFTAIQMDNTAMAAQIVASFGGIPNIIDFEHSSTRLRITVVDDMLVRETELKKANITGMIRPSLTTWEVIVGPRVQFVYDEIKKMS